MRNSLLQAVNIVPFLLSVNIVRIRVVIAKSQIFWGLLYR
jgi:hypothetical protein